MRRKIYGPRRHKVIGEWRRLPENFHGDQTKNIEMGGARWLISGAGEVHTGFCWVNLSERGHLEDLTVDGKIILKLTFKK